MNIWTLIHKFLASKLTCCVVVLLALITVLPAGFAMVNLYTHMRSDLEALLPINSPAVKGVQMLRNRMEGAQHLGIVIRGTHPGPPLTFATELGNRLRLYATKHPELIRSVRTDIAPERRFIKERAPLYLPVDVLRDVRYHLELLIQRWQKINPLFLSQTDTTPVDMDFLDLKATQRSIDPFYGRFPNDQLVSNDGLTAVVVVFLATADTGIGTIGPFVDHVRREVAALEPKSTNLSVGYAGDVAIAVEELSALESDIGVSAAFVFVGIISAMLIFFRWWGALVVLALPLAIGTIWGFGLSSFFVKSLCSSTAFLGSIVVGNGINCGIILMARYTDERQAGKNPIDAIKVAIRGTWMGTLAATFAASAGYASLLTTTFRGFNEFAIIGSVGMLACWLATYFLLPPLLRLLDRRRQIQVIGTRGLTSPGSWLENAVIKKSRTILMISVLLLLASLTALTRFNDSYIEYNMSNLRNRHSAINGEGYWSRQMDQVTGRNFTAVALMANSEADARVIGAQLRQQARVPPLSAITSRIVTSEDVLPPDQEQRQGEVQKIVQLLNPVILSALSEADRATMDSFIKAAKAPVIVPADLPELLVLGLREKDGQFGRTALLLQSLDGSTWNGVLTIQAAAKLRDIAVKVTPPADIAGGFFVSANVLEVLDRVALPTTLTAFIAVCLIVLILFRARRHAFWVLFSLLMGVSFMACAVIVFNLRINFINFMAFPITFGIGVEYAVNVLQRYRENPVDMTAIVGKTGSAVALCSLTTILGYGSLLVASNQALFSFGVLAVIGEITCLLTAILILPALLATLNKPVKA